MNNEKKIPGESNSVPLQGLGVVNMFYGALPIHFEFAKKLRANQTESELYLWEQLSRLKHLNVRFKRQQPILYFIADFYCHKAKLVIEIDGGYHDIPEQYIYDINRDAELEELGLKVIRFSNDEVIFNIENVLQIIGQNISYRTSIKN